MFYIWVMIATLISSMPAYAQTPATTEDFWSKATIALVSAVFAFLGSYALYRIQESRKTRLQLSYQTSTDVALAPSKGDIFAETEIEYRGEKVTDLYQVMCVVKNTGMRW